VGVKGETGVKGERGEKGDRGRPGRPGVVGLPGTDGTFMNISIYSPTQWRHRDFVCLYACLYVCMSVCLSVHLFFILVPAMAGKVFVFGRLRYCVTLLPRNVRENIKYYRH